jgi:hypothetical protein
MNLNTISLPTKARPTTKTFCKKSHPECVLLPPTRPFFSCFFVIKWWNLATKKNTKKKCNTHNSFSFMTFEWVSEGERQGGRIEQDLVVKKSPLGFLSLVMFFSSLLVVDLPPFLPPSPPPTTSSPLLKLLVCCWLGSHLGLWILMLFFFFHQY